MAMPALAKLCPALVRMSYRPVPATRNDRIHKAKDLLGQHQVLVISGSSQQSFDANTQIGKTHMVKSGLIPLLERRGINPYYFNLDLITGILCPSYHIFSDKYIGTFGDFFPDAPIYIFDEAHCMFLWQECDEAEIVFRIKFWNKMRVFLEKGRQVVFITALHPLQSVGKNFYATENVLCFYTAPVLELPAQTGFIRPSSKH